MMKHRVPTNKPEEPTDTSKERHKPSVALSMKVMRMIKFTKFFIV